MTTPKNLGIPTFRPHHNNQPLPAPRPESTKPWTKSKNKTPKPIQSTIAPTFTTPPTTATSQDRGISTIHPHRTSNCKPATRQPVRIHGPNRRTRDEIGTGPQQRRTIFGLRSRLHHETAEPQGLTVASKTGRRRTRHASARTRGLNRRTRAENQSSPRQHRPTTDPQPQHHHKNRRTPTIHQHHENQAPAHQPSDNPNPRTKPEIARRKQNQTTFASADTRTLATTPPQTRRIP